jgi:hypothetical protein
LLVDLFVFGDLNEWNISCCCWFEVSRKRKVEHACNRWVKEKKKITHKGRNLERRKDIALPLEKGTDDGENTGMGKTQVS